MNPNTKALVEKLTPIVTKFGGGDGIAADDLRYFAENSGICLFDYKSSVVSTALTGALRAAGYKPTNKTVTSTNIAAKSRRVIVWERA